MKSLQRVSISIEPYYQPKYVELRITVDRFTSESLYMYQVLEKEDFQSLFSQTMKVAEQQFLRELEKTNG